MSKDLRKAYKLILTGAIKPVLIGRDRYLQWVSIWKSLWIHGDFKMDFEYLVTQLSDNDRNKLFRLAIDNNHIDDDQYYSSSRNRLLPK